MNKWIKNKKCFIMESRKSFTKEENIFTKQFQRLYAFCEIANINRLIIIRLYKYILKHKFISKDEFQISMVSIFVNIYNSNEVKYNSKCQYYIDLYSNMGIKFIKENNRIKINYIEVK